MPDPSLLLLAALLTAPTPSEPDPAGDPSREPLPLRVDWTAEPSCPNAEALRVELARLLHRELRFDPTAEARIEAVIRGHRGAFVLELSVFAGELHEQRTLTAERCEEFRTAAALVVALALEPWAAGFVPHAVPEPEGEPADTPPTAPQEQDTAGTEVDRAGDHAATQSGAGQAGEPATRVPLLDAAASFGLDPPAPPSPPEPPARRPGRVGLLVQGGLGIAQHTTLAGGLGGAIAYLGRGWRIELTGIHWWPTHKNAAKGVTVHARLTAGGVRGCWAPGRGRWELQLCGGLEAGAMRARATGPSVTPITSTGPWLGLLVGAGAVWRVTGWMAVRASADLTVAAWRPAFHLDQASKVVPVFTPPPVGVRMLVGVELRLPSYDE
jgi:hypothetical protein